MLADERSGRGAVQETHGRTLSRRTHCSRAARRQRGSLHAARTPRAALSCAALWQIEAEVLHELTEAAKVESVPTFLILKAGAELHRIAGADVVRPRAQRIYRES